MTPPPDIGLLSGERLLWQGRPRGGLRFGWIDVPVTLFMLFWAGIPASAAWTSATNGLGVFDVFLLPFLLIGAYMLVGRLLIDAWLRSRTRYVLTTERAIIRRDGPFATERSAQLARVAEIRIGGGGRYGSVTFSTGGSLWFARRGLGMAGMPRTEPAFVMIDDARRVYELAQQAARGHGLI